MMKIILQGLILVCAINLVACKIVNSHTFKVTSPVDEQQTEMLLKTTIGDVYLSTEKMTDKDRDILNGMKRYQCIKISSPETLSMDNYQVHYQDFEIRKIAVRESECRKIKTGLNITIR